MVAPPPQHDEEPDFTPMSAAMEWVSRVLSMTFAMVGPIVAGVWIDHRLGTQWVTPVAAAGGLVLGIAYLLVLTSGKGSSAKQPPPHTTRSNRRETDDTESDRR